MGYVRHTYDSPSPNEEHEVKLDPEDVEQLPEIIDDAEALAMFLQI